MLELFAGELLLDELVVVVVVVIEEAGKSYTKMGFGSFLMRRILGALMKVCLLEFHLAYL